MTNMHFVKSKENLIMIAIRKVPMLSLVLSVAACGNDGQPPQEGQPPPAVQASQPRRPADQAADQKGGIYWPAAVDRQAKIIYLPTMPSGDDLDFDGITVIQVVVGTDGIVETAFVEGTSGRVDVDSLMLDIVRKTIFTPAIHDGAVVKMRQSLPIILEKSLPTPGEETVTEE